jgi:hypothetical protein
MSYFDFDGGESVSQPPLKNKAFSTFLDQNPPFEQRPENGVSSAEHVSFAAKNSSSARRWLVTLGERDIQLDQQFQHYT